MTLEEIRKRIDSIDEQMKQLFLMRMNVAHDVATVKNDAHETNIYRADRERSMIERLTADVDPALTAQYAAFIRKTTEVSRMYQYNLLCQWNPEYSKELVRGIAVDPDDTKVKITLTRPDACNSMSAILSMIGDYGYNMEEMRLLGMDAEQKTASFELVIRGNLADEKLQILLFQLYKESLDLKVLESLR